MFDNFGKPIQEVSTPALVVDADQLDYNIQLKSEYIRETHERSLPLVLGREDITIMNCRRNMPMVNWKRTGPRFVQERKLTSYPATAARP